MKKLTFTLALMISFVAFSLGNPAGATVYEYEITKVENLHLGKSIEKLWTVDYSKAQKPITITLKTGKYCKEYIVRSEFFEVIYACTENGFGVQKMHSNMKKIPAKITSAVINKQQMEKQRILVPEYNISEDYALGLIASYLPDLLNEDYRHLIL